MIRSSPVFKKKRLVDDNRVLTKHDDKVVLVDDFYSDLLGCNSN